MKLWRTISILWKLNLLLVAISAGVLLLVSAGYVFQYRDEFKKTMVTEAEALAAVVGFSSAPALLFEDHAAAAQSIAALGVKKNIAAAYIYDNRGALFCAHNPKNLPQDFPSSPPEDNWHYFDDTYLHVFHTIEINDNAVGTIYIMISMDELSKRQFQYAVIAGIIFCVGFVLTVLLSFVLQRLLMEPILSLSATVREISLDKNYTLRAVKKTDDEIGTLIDGFNQMVQEIQSHDIYLEEKVARRTAELKTANENLIEEMQERMEIEREREKLIVELRTLLAEVKTLTGMLPICCSCKKIRDDQGYWRQIETYLQDHSNAEFSHGICPECAKKLYPDFYSDK